MKTDTHKNNAHQSEAATIIKDRKLTDFEHQVVDLWNLGKSATEIAKELHVTRNTIMGKIWRMRQKGVSIEKHARPNTRGANAKPRALRRSAPLIDLIFKKQKEEKIRSVIRHKEPPPANSLNIRFKDLRNDSCRYVVNDGRPENYIFCGAPKTRGSYCSAHASMCYAPPRSPSPQQQHPTLHRQSYK